MTSVKIMYINITIMKIITKSRYVSNPPAKRNLVNCWSNWIDLFPQKRLGSIKKAWFKTNTYYYKGVYRCLVGDTWGQIVVDWVGSWTNQLKGESNLDHLPNSWVKRNKKDVCFFFPYQLWNVTMSIKWPMLTLNLWIGFTVFQQLHHGDRMFFGYSFRVNLDIHYQTGDINRFQKHSSRSS